MRPCNCGSKLQASDCCEPLLNGSRNPATAEALMRSRYSAFTEQKAGYLLATWHPETRPASLDFENCRWLGLKVLTTKLGTDLDDEGWVSFVARYKVAGKAFRIEENSYFTRINKRWFYVNGGD